MTGLSWTPKRTGAIYCAPACGSGCTWDAHQKAVRDAARLAKECGPGYTPRVNENLGWHFSATHSSNCCTVYRDGKYYMAMIGPDQPGGRWVGRGPTAKDAVADGVRRAKAELDGIKAVVDFVEGTP